MLHQPKILVYDREYNLKKWYIYWIPSTRTLGVKDATNSVYEKMMTVQDRVNLLNCSKSLVDDKWNDVFAQFGLHIDSVAEKELVLTFALDRCVTLEKTEINGSFDDLLYLEYLRMKTMLHSTPNKRKRTASAVEHSNNDVKPSTVPKMSPLKKRVTRSTVKSNGPEFEELE